jgi:hypothetical protein
MAMKEDVAATLTEFVRVASGAGEPAIIIGSNTDLQKALRELDAHGFTAAEDAGSIGSRSYAYITSDNLKDWYDAAAQFASRQITYTDRKKLKQKSVSVEPARSCFVLACPSDLLDSQLDLRSVCGPAIAL